MAQTRRRHQSESQYDRRWAQILLAAVKGNLCGRWQRIGARREVRVISLRGVELVRRSTNQRIVGIPPLGGHFV